MKQKWTEKEYDEAAASASRLEVLGQTPALVPPWLVGPSRPLCLSVTDDRQLPVLL